MPENKKRKILIFNGRFRSAFVLIFTLLLICLSASFAGNTVSYFTSKLAAASDSARVAKWNVSVSIEDSPIALKYNSGWSTPYKIEIQNNSEVMASYGHDADDDLNANYSYLTFSNLPVTVNQVRIFDPASGVIRDLSASLNNRSIVVRFSGVLNPGETKTYYIQFSSGVQDTSVAYENTVVVHAQFYFEQAFKGYLNLAVGMGVNSNALSMAKISSDGVSSKVAGTNSGSVSASEITGVNSGSASTSKITAANSDSVSSAKLSGVSSDAVSASFIFNN